MLNSGQSEDLLGNNRNFFNNEGILIMISTYLYDKNLSQNIHSFE